MTAKELKRLTPLEALIMNALWDKAPATVRQVQECLRHIKPMAYNTVLTMMRILREKGFLVSERVGRTDSYRPVVTREQMGRRSLGELLESFFAGSPRALVSQLLDAETLDAEELEAIRRQVDEKMRHQTEEEGGQP